MINVFHDKKVKRFIQKRTYHRLGNVFYGLARGIHNRYVLEKAIKQGKELKLVIDANWVCQNSWIATDKESLNLLNEKHWEKYFTENSISAMLSEHVWEHLTMEDGFFAAKLCYKYLKPGGYIRVAVPDGFHPQKEYIDYVKPNGIGKAAWDHKVLYDTNNLTALFTKVGFKVNALEYYDDRKQFHYHPWKVEDGVINRSFRFDKRNSGGQINYTSLIIDAIKPFQHD